LNINLAKDRMLSLRLWLGGKIYGSEGISAKRISPKRMVKWNCEEPELEAQRYIAANATIPIPRIYGVHERRGKLQSNLVVTMVSVQGVFNRYIDVIVITDMDLSGHVRSRSQYLLVSSPSNAFL
jgi:hypothetical protein